MRLLGNIDNLLRDAEVTATNIVPSQAIFARPDLRMRTGAGDVRVIGDYTGQQDQVVEVEIISDTISGVPSTSAPTYSGEGNATIEDIAIAPGTTAQEMTVELIDLGTETRSASTTLGGRQLVAANEGPAGNDITVDIDQSGLSFAATEYSTPGPIPRGTSELTGDQWDFGHGTLDAEGCIPADAPRVSFGNRPFVHRLWKEHRGEWVYGISPPVPYDIGEGEPVRLVSGARSVTVTDGASPETYTDVRSLFDLLEAVRLGSTLVDVTGVVTNDCLPGGIGADDLRVYTRSYARDVEVDGGEILQDLESLAVEPDAPTEIVRITCDDNAVLGSERWSIDGDVSGSLPDAISGVLYDETASPLGFVIPQVIPTADQAPDGDVTLEPRPQYDQDRPTPCMNLYRPVLGANARDLTVTFTYRRRPEQSDCNCASQPVIGGPTDDCLGIEGDGSVSNAIPSELHDLFVRLYNWRQEFVAANAQIASGSGLEEVSVSYGSTGELVGNQWSASMSERYSAALSIDPVDIRFADAVTQVFARGMTDLYAALGETHPGNVDADWSNALDDLETATGAIDAASGGKWWVMLGKFIGGSGGPFGQADKAAAQAEAGYNLTTLTTDITMFLRRFEARRDRIFANAGVQPNFNDAGIAGSLCWQDTGATHWWVPDQNFMPLFTNTYYFFPRQTYDDDGQSVIQPTFIGGFALQACESELREGDKFVLRIENVINQQSRYQIGDRYSVRVVRAQPKQLSGGQTGDDTYTFSVTGSDSGALPNYLYDRNSPVAYSEGGVSFGITAGGIPLGLGWRGSFFVEGGQFQWRVDGGAWVGPEDISDTVSIGGDGLIVQFIGGAGASYVTGDRYGVEALAINGPSRASSPRDEYLRWTTETQIVVPGGAADSLMIAAHTIPAGATITLEGSDDGFSTTPLSESVTWRESAITHLFDANHAEYRVSIDGGDGAVGWLFIGQGRTLDPVGGHVQGNYAEFVANYALAAPGVAAGIGGQISLAWMTQGDVDRILEALSHARANDENRFGYLQRDDAPDLAMVVSYDADSVQVTEADKYSHSGESRRYLSATLPVSAVR